MEVVQKIEWYPKWEGGAPLPQVFSNGQKIYLIYYVADWEDDLKNEIKPLGALSSNQQLIALVTFDGHTFKFGIANDEVFPGLPLYKEGLNKWAHQIENSRWIEELKEIHKVHPLYNPLNWRRLNHYVFLFKDDILEVIARSYSVEVYRTTYLEIGVEILRRMHH